MSDGPVETRAPKRQEIQQAKTVMGGNKNDEPLNSPEARATRLLEHIDKAELDSFQEYRYVAIKQGGGFIVQEGKYKRPSQPDDLIVPSSYYANYATGVAIQQSLEDMFGVPNPGPNKERSKGELFCAIGKKGDAVVVQGGGSLNYDSSHRLNSLYFKLVFNSQKAEGEFTDWLEEDPNLALSSVLSRAIGTYSEDGEFQGTILPQNALSFEREPADPFAGMPIRTVNLKFLDTNEVVRKNLEGTSGYNRAKEEINIKKEAAIADYKRSQEESNARRAIKSELARAEKGPIEKDTVVPKTNKERPKESSVQSSGRDQDNPSGLNPNAPLTKLINLAIRPFIRGK